jgi:hypothetical protein
MTSRQWTREDLDRVHPLPDGWTWEQDYVGEWCAANRTTKRRPGLVRLTDDGRLDGGVKLGPDELIPADVALAVILASQGLDSLAALADAVHETLVTGSASERLWVAAMVRRGKVTP